jgi:hypothetical protein
MSLTTDIENTSTSQQMSKVKMRDHSGKKKSALRDLKSRISLPPEIKNGFIPRSNNNQFSESNNSKLQVSQRSSYYQTSSLSSQTLNTPLNRSNASLSHLSPHSGGQLSRNEHRLSMLDLGYGKIESYTRLEKLGEGKND